MPAVQHRLFIISGPSCVGKTPLVSALQKLYPDVMASFVSVVLYNSRKPRPGEEEGRDYYFRSERWIRTLDTKESFVVRKVRNDWQALDLDELRKRLTCKDVLYEGNPDFAQFLMTDPRFDGIPRSGVFITPFSNEEIQFIDRQPDIDVETFLTGVMYEKQFRRFQRQNGPPQPSDIADMKVRAQCAYSEMKSASLYDCVIANHDGEDSSHWDVSGYPIGEARQTMLAVLDWLKCGAAKEARGYK